MNLRCVKCNEMDIAQTWLREVVAEAGLSLMGGEYNIEPCPEHLGCACRTCGYRWNQHTGDSGKMGVIDAESK